MTSAPDWIVDRARINEVRPRWLRVVGRYSHDGTVFAWDIDKASGPGRARYDFRNCRFADDAARERHASIFAN